MIINTIKDVANISLLIVLLLFCYLLIGMELFAHKLPRDIDEELLKHNHRKRLKETTQAKD